MSVSSFIRAGVERDIPAIAALLTALNRSEGYTTITDEAALRDALFGDGREVALHALVAVEGEEVVATLLFYAGYDTLSASVGYHLADMVVAHTHQRRGIGKLLVQALAKQTLAEGKEWVSLTALTRNDAARAFYQSLGMTQVDVAFYAIGRTALAQL